MATQGVMEKETCLFLSPLGPHESASVGEHKNSFQVSPHQREAMLSASIRRVLIPSKMWTARRRGLATAPAAALNHCVELVRTSDRERYICNLHAPMEARPGLFALHAFNLETARIRSSTTTEATAQGRFAWWRRTLDQALDGAPPEHPVATALAHAHAKYRFTTRYLTQTLDARESDVSVQQPRSMDELAQYAERTAGSMLLLGLECGGVTGDEAAERAAAHAGIALGIATLLRGTAAHASQGCTYLPAEVTKRHNVSLSTVRTAAPKHVPRHRPTP